jgi:hypothetical protein
MANWGSLWFRKMACQKQMVSKIARQKQMVSKMSGNPSDAGYIYVYPGCFCVSIRTVLHVKTVNQI